MQSAKEVNQTPVPIWVQSPYSNYAYNVEPMLRLMAEKDFLERPDDVSECLDFLQDIFLQNIHRDSMTEAHDLADCIYYLRLTIKFFRLIGYKMQD